MTARGAYLKALVASKTGRISTRELAKRLAERPDFPDNAELVRRSLLRYMTDASEKRDVGDRYVLAISEVLDLDPEDWPEATRSPTKAALRQRVKELEQELARTRRSSGPSRSCATVSQQQR